MDYEQLHPSHLVQIEQNRKSRRPVVIFSPILGTLRHRVEVLGEAIIVRAVVAQNPEPGIQLQDGSQVAYSIVIQFAILR